MGVLDTFLSLPSETFALLIQEIITEGQFPGNPKWVWKNIGKRQNVGFSIWEQPWTGQAGIELKGLRRQEGFPNFLWDVINQRHVREVKAQKLSVGDPLSRDVLTDVREGMAHQKAGGNVTMKCRSLVYWHNGDRALTGEDHMLCNGWNLDELDLDCVAEPLPNDLKDAWDEHLGWSAVRKGGNLSVALWMFACVKVQALG